MNLLNILPFFIYNYLIKQIILNYKKKILNELYIIISLFIYLLFRFFKLYKIICLIRLYLESYPLINPYYFPISIIFNLTKPYTYLIKYLTYFLNYFNLFNNLILYEFLFIYFLKIINLKFYFLLYYQIKYFIIKKYITYVKN